MFSISTSGAETYSSAERSWPTRNMKPMHWKAIVAALSTLLVACGQLVQVSFGTADGRIGGLSSPQMMMRLTR